MTDTPPSIPVLDLAPQKGMGRVRTALEDFTGALRLLPLALALGWLDIKLRYRGSVLGPFWLTLSTIIMIAAMGGVYGYLFHMDLPHYLPFLSLSIVLWAYLSGLVNESAMVFTQSAAQFHSCRIPVTLPVFRMIIRNTLIFLHNIVVIVAVFAIYHVWPHVRWEFLGSSLIWFLDSFAIILLIGMLGARFRDVAPVMASLMQILFFVTPVIWKPELVYVGRQYLLLDPFYPMIEIVRGPLMGQEVRMSVWGAAMLEGAVLWGLAAMLFCRMRARVAYWI